MKKVILLAILFVTAVSFTSCSKSSSAEDTTPTTDNFIKFKFKNVQYVYEPETVTSLSKLIQGFDLSRRITIWLPLNYTVGTHQIVYAPSNLTTYEAKYSENSPALDFDGTSGTITITAVTSTTIEGTFSFSGTQGGVNYQITEGSFKAPKGS